MTLETPDFQAYRGQEPPRFANRAELECAKVLDYYGVPWDYEPTTFVLEEDEDGRVVEAFTPDFYLPEPPGLGYDASSSWYRWAKRSMSRL